MFTGIIETIGKVTQINREGGNVHFEISSNITPELKIDQSVSHNGVCLTVVAIHDNSYVVTAIQETLDKTNLGDLVVGSEINLERAMKLGDRLDGHIVQGHVDQVATCQEVSQADGSWYYRFSYSLDADNVTIEKGSITINGVSLTVVDSTEGGFSVAIIPYTYEHTNFKNLKSGDVVNLEFDVIGKYVQRLMNGYQQS